MKKRIRIIALFVLILMTAFSFMSIFASGNTIMVWSNSQDQTVKQTNANLVNENKNNITEDKNQNEINGSNIMNNNRVTNATTTNTKTSTNTTIKNETNKTTVVTSSDIENKDGNFLGLTSGSSILIEQNSGQVLYANNEHDKLNPASVTKVMTILLIMESLEQGVINLDTKIPCTENAASMGGSQIWLDVREELTVDEMLKAICVVSANDCTVAMAEYLNGSQEGFVQRMNEKAKQLGMNDTTFKNCHGIDEDGHQTSSYDIALMSKELLNKYPQITKYTTIYMDSLRDGKSELVNTNKLVKNYQGATGLKTGSTSVALYNLSASATKNDLSLIAVIMKGETSKIRFDEAKKLLDYGFNNYEYKEFAKKDEVVQTIEINKGTQKECELIFEESAGALLKKGDDAQIEQSIQMANNIFAPVKKGDKLGEVVFSIKGEEVKRVSLIANQDITKNNLGDILEKIYRDWFFLMR